MSTTRFKLRGLRGLAGACASAFAASAGLALAYPAPVDGPHLAPDLSLRPDLPPAHDILPYIDATVPPAPRVLRLRNTHTDERVEAVYKRGDTYDEDGIRALENVLRDHRQTGTAAQKHFNREAFDLLGDIAAEIERRYPGKEVTFDIISGYRSPATNRMLRAAGGEQAVSSRHMHGDAIDIRVNGISRTELRDIAWCVHRGGVGDYPPAEGDFVHVDVYKAKIKDPRFAGGSRYRRWGWYPVRGQCQGPVR